MAGAATDVAEQQIGNVREFLAKKRSSHLIQLTDLVNLCKCVLSDKQLELTKHSRSLAGRDMMMKSFLTSSMTKLSSELSERS